MKHSFQSRHPLVYLLFWLVVIPMIVSGAVYAAGIHIGDCPAGYVASGDRGENECEPLGIVVPIPIGYNGPLPGGATPAPEIGG